MTVFKRNIEGEKRLVQMFEKENIKVLIDLVNEYPISTLFKSKCLDNITDILNKIGPDKEWLYRYPEKDFFEFLEKLIGPLNTRTQFLYHFIIENVDYSLKRPSKTKPEMVEYLRNNLYVKRNIVRNLYHESKITEMFTKEQLRQKLDLLSGKCTTDYITGLAEITHIVDKIGPDRTWLYKYSDKDLFAVLKQWLGPCNENSEPIYRVLIIDRDEFLKNTVKSDEELTDYILNNITEIK